MITITLTMIVFTLLLVVSIIDFKTKKVPSFLTTALIFLVAMVNMTEVQFGLIHLSFGILAFVFAYMLYELNFINGIADIKVLTIIGMMVKTIPYFFFFLIFTVAYGCVYKLFWRFVLKKEYACEVPYIASLLITYVALWLGGGLI